MLSLVTCVFEYVFQSIIFTSIKCEASTIIQLFLNKFGLVWMIVFSREFLLSPVRYTGMHLSYNKHSNSYNARLDCIGVHVRVYTNCKNYTKYVHIKLDKLFLYLHKSRHLAFLWVYLRYPRVLLQNIYYISTRFYRLGKA